MKSKSRITKQPEAMYMYCLFAVLLCWFLAPLGSGAQSNDRWGPWAEWSPCSRTCGVGVSYQERKCLEEEKPEEYCKGHKRTYMTCNIQDCPEGSRDFRLEQCEAYNNRTLDKRRYKWVPYIPTHERCVLNCMPKGEYFFMRWADKVVDGTKCSVDSYDICVDGACEKLGCDLILNSNAKEDKCRVCKGNGENCKTHKGVNTDDGDGYKEILVIPASATNIDIQEMAPSSNYLALSDSSRSYFFNGDYVIRNPKKFHVAGAVFNYERTRLGQERIFSLGPTSISVHVEVLLMGIKNPGISYEFSLPTSVTKLPEPAQFSWRTGEFDKCSLSCAGGEQKRRVYCVRDNSGEEVSKSNCDHDKKPSHKQKCNTQPCPASWYVSSWSSCSMTCGRGKQVRRVHCQHVVEGGDIEMIADEQCPGPKPITMRVCQMQRSCPEWSVDQWSKCSASCGLGSKKRNVTCEMPDTKTIFQPESCNLAFKPKDEEICNPGPCTVTWTASDWSKCYPKCGKGMSTRMVYCVSISDKNQKYPDDLCDASARPIGEKNCSSDALCPPMWHGSQWSKCTATCGVGMQMRNVYCAKREGPKMLRIMSINQCIKEGKMNGVQKCSANPCQAGWYIYPWEPCSKTCGQGVRRRTVKCFADSKEDPEEKWCKADDKPESQEQCFEEECEVPTTVITTPTQTTTAVTTKQSSPATTISLTTTEEEEATTETATTEAPAETTTTEPPAETTTTTEARTTTVQETTPTPTTEETEEITTTAAETQTTTTAAETTTATVETPTTKTVEEEETTTTDTPATTAVERTTTEAAEETTTAAATETQTTTTEAAETTITTVATEETTTATTTTEAVQKTTATAEDTTTEAFTTPTSASSFSTTESTTTTGISTETSPSTSSTIPSTTQLPTTETTTTDSRTTTTPTPTTEASTTTTPPSTTESSTTTAPPPTTEASITTTPPSTTESSSTTAPPPTTEASITTTPPPTTEASAPPPTTVASTTTAPPPTTEASTTTTPPPTTEPQTTARRIQPARIVQPPQDLMAYVGTEVLFRCRATGYPEPVVTWRKGSIPVTSLDSSRIQILPDGDLRIADITEDDNDIYTCTATNFVGPMDTKKARLAVIVPVSASVSPKNATAQPGVDVTITCEVRGIPTPIVEWYKNGQALSSQGRVRVSRTKVIVSQVQTSDSGYYTCRAIHNYGMASDKMYLNVIEDKVPTEPPIKCEDNPAIAHCAVVRRVNFCCVPYYQKACCKTCEDLLSSC